jgi:hypothetical protein
VVHNFKKKGNKTMRWVISRVTMKKTGSAFVDVVTGDIVHYWKDYYGQAWLAVTRWGFRVSTKY